MLLPVKNYTARGFLWYQGESNLFNYQIYAPMMTAMVQLWRNVWEAPDMPFYYVQIAPHKYGNSRNINSALLQEAQMKALQTIPNSGMIPTIDVGDEFCIHPPQKNVVGLRLANLALTKTYGLHKFPSTGPMMTKVEYSKRTKRSSRSTMLLPDWHRAAVNWKVSRLQEPTRNSIRQKHGLQVAQEMWKYGAIRSPNR